ncbi:MAG: hypothetical protein K2I18_10485 [Paramuribaculum sp.]|nr:hypothetical protein [Paramuribaculum sp.]
MNFTLTPGVYAALNLLSKATRNKVLEAAFAFVICGIRPTNLSKNLLVMFMMVVDSATEGKLTYVPDASAEEKTEEPAPQEAEPQPEAQPAEPEPVKAQEEVYPTEEKHYHFHLTGGNGMLSDDEIKSASGVKIKKVKSPRRRKRNRNAAR